MNNEQELKSMMNDLNKHKWGLHLFLNEDKTYRVCTLMEWANQFGHMDRHVANEEVNDCRISTIWLGTNLNYLDAPPLVLETMVFKDGSDIYCERYTTWQEAEEGHKKAVQWVKDGCIHEDEE